MRVRASIDFWREIGASPLILRWIREGVRIDWLHRPPSPFHHGVSRTQPEHREWLTAECDRCLLTGAFVRATCLDYVSKAFIVEHNGKKRLVFNLKHLNDYCVKRQCRFGSLSALRRTLHEGDLMWSIDLTDAYHHVGIYEPHQKYFTFAIETARGVEYFSTGALNFGWCRSPQIFTDIMKPIIAYLRNPPPGLPVASVLPWLDDFLMSCNGLFADAIRARDFSFDTLERCGVRRNVTKGQPEPSTMLFDHLGYGIDSAAMRFLLTTKRERKLRLVTSALLRWAARSRRLVRVAVDAFAQLWADESLVWAHPPPALLPQLVQLLEATPSASAIVCVPHWPGSQWFRPLAELSAEMLVFPPGSLQRVAFDAPALLAQWGVAAFRVLPR